MRHLRTAPSALIHEASSKHRGVIRPNRVDRLRKMPDSIEKQGAGASAIKHSSSGTQRMGMANYRSR